MSVNTLPPDARARHYFLCAHDAERAERMKMAEWITNKNSEEDGVEVDGGSDESTSRAPSAYPKPGRPTQAPADPTEADAAASDLLQRLWEGEELDPEILSQLQEIVASAYSDSQCLEVILESILDADESVVDQELVAQLSALLRPAPKKYWTRSTRSMARYLERLAR